LVRKEPIWVDESIFFDFFGRPTSIWQFSEMECVAAAGKELPDRSDERLQAPVKNALADFAQY